MVITTLQGVQYSSYMRLSSPLVRNITLGITFLVLVFLGLCATRSEKPSLSVTVATEPIPVLSHHAHGAGDKVSDLHHGVMIESPIVEIPETMWVTEFSIDAANAPRNTIHHLHLIRLLPDGSGRTSERSVLTVGQDTVPRVTFPAPSGIFFKKGEKVAIDAILHNPLPPNGEGGTYEDVVVRVTMSGVPDDRDRYGPLFFNLPRVTDSTSLTDDDSTFEVPVGEGLYTRNSKDNPESSAGASHVFSGNGWIVSMGVHMHAWQGAKRLDTYLNGKRLRTYTSYLLDPKIPWSFESEYGPVLTRVNKGDVLTVSATYENENDVPIEGAMGMAGLYYTNDRFFSLGSSLYQIPWTIKGWFLGAWDAVTAPFAG